MSKRIGPRAFRSIQKGWSEYLIKPVELWWYSSQKRKKAPKLIKIGSKMLPKWFQNRFQNGPQNRPNIDPKRPPKGTPLGKPFLTNGPSKTLTFGATWSDTWTGSALNCRNYHEYEIATQRKQREHSFQHSSVCVCARVSFSCTWLYFVACVRLCMILPTLACITRLAALASLGVRG